ncbi:hypothetical protein Pfo_006912 [Paulownia fortunei]|nr:hypothetical protein Pfo_006912 [Paulownia fortunei]
MGNYRFRLSDMMPNAWFYKLKDMSKSRNQNPSHPINKKLPLPTQGPRNSLYHTTESISVDRLHNSPANPKAFDTHFPHDPPRKSSKKRTKRKTIYKPSPRRITPSAASAGRICREPGNPAWIKPETVLVKDCFESTVSCHTSPDQQDFLESISSEFEYSDSFDAPHQWMDEGPASWPSSCSCSLSSSASDIIIDMNETRYNTKKIDKVEFDMVSEPELPPILTRPRKHNALQESPEFKNSSVKFQTEKHSTQKKKNTKTATSPATRKSFSHSGGVKIQGNRAKLGSKKIDTRGRKSLKGEKKGCFYSESLAIVKASFDPEKDFRDSMMEMIVENNIRASKDLEELLACYLSLNSSQYHHLIIKAFEQIWFNMPQSHL